MRSSSSIVLNGSVMCFTSFQGDYGQSAKRVNDFYKGEQMKITLFVLSFLCVLGIEKGIEDILGDANWQSFSIITAIDLLFLIFWAIVINKGWFNEF